MPLPNLSVDPSLGLWSSAWAQASSERPTEAPQQEGRGQEGNEKKGSRHLYKPWHFTELANRGQPLALLHLRNNR
ncbi:unnamed protein product [Gadus morhua 'NCC']